MIINTNIALLPALADSFNAKKAADASVSDKAFTIAGSMIAVDKASGDLTPMIGTGKDSIAASGVSRFAPALDAPVAKDQGMAVQDGTTGYFVLADAAVNVYGYDENAGIWLQLGSPGAKEGFNVPMNSEYAHAEHGNVNISRVFVRDPSASDAARSQARMIPQKNISGASASSAAGKSQFTKDVEIDQDLQVDGALSAGTATLGSWTVEGNLMSGPVMSAGSATLGSWTVSNSTFKPAPGSDGIFQTQQAGDAISLIDWSGSQFFRMADGEVKLGPINGEGVFKLVATQDSVRVGPIGLDGISLNIADSAASFGKANSVNLKADANFVFAGKPGTAANGLYVHKEHGVCLVSAAGKAFGLRVDEAGNITTTDLNIIDPDLEVPMC